MVIKINYTNSQPIIKINYDVSPIYIKTSISKVYVKISYGGSSGNFVPYTGATTNVNLGEYQLATGQVTFDQSPTGIAGVGVMRWNDADGTLDLGLKGGNVTLQIGQEQVARVVNKSGIQLTEANYQVVKVTSAQGQRLAVDLAQGNNDANSTDTIGIVTENIDNNQEGFICTSGLVREINTTGSLQSETWVDGDVLYLSPTVAGKITNIKPTAPSHTVILGYVVYAHAIHGKIFVKCDNGYELSELHNVYAPSPNNNDGIFWNNTNLRYENNSISEILGYTPVTSARTISTTSPLSGGGDLSANRTLAITQATTITDGYLSSTDWNTFNSKESALTFSSPLSRSVNTISIPVATTSVNGYLSSTDFTTFNGKFTLPSLTSGSVLFSNGTTIAQDNANLFWDDTNNRLGIGTNSPQSQFHIQGSSAGIRLIRTGGLEPFILLSNSSTSNFGGQIRANVDSAGFKFSNFENSTTWFQIFSTGNIGINQTTDGGQRLQVQGTSLLNGGTTISGSTTAATAIARGVNITPTLVAAANNDVLVGMDITPTFTNGAFTGVINSAIRVTKSTNSTLIGFGIIDATNTVFDIVYPISGGLRFGSLGSDGAMFQGYGGTNSSFAGQMYFDYGSIVRNITTRKAIWRSCTTSTATEIMTLTAAGRLLLGTSTESTYILDVSGTARIQGALTLKTSANSNYQFNSSVYTNRIGLQQLVFADTFFDLYPQVATGGKDIGFVVWAKGIPGNITNSELLEFRYDNTNSRFALDILQTGTGSLRPFHLYIGTNTNQLKLQTNGNVSINSASDNASAQLQVDSTTKGFLPPRMTNAQRTAIGTPAVGLIVYCTDTVEGLYIYKSTGWTFVI